MPFLTRDTSLDDAKGERFVLTDRRRGVARPSSTADHLIDPRARAWSNGHRGAVIWLTGLPAAGKSTLAMQLERRLFRSGRFVYVLDGDNVRSGLSRDLGFSRRDRKENVRRVGEVAALFADAGAIAIVALISPFRADRRTARLAAADAFREIYVKAEIATCERRDPKGLYAMARAGLLQDFTGIDSPYEEPLDPDLIIDTDRLTISQAVDALCAFVEDATALGAPAISDARP